MSVGAGRGINGKIAFVSAARAQQTPNRTAKLARTRDWARQLTACFLSAAKANSDERLQHETTANIAIEMRHRAPMETLSRGRRECEQPKLLRGIVLTPGAGFNGSW